MSVGGAVKRINISGTEMKVTIIGNFDVIAATVNPNFQQTGTWYDYFSGESIEVTDVSEEIILNPGEYHIYTSVQLETPDITDPDTGFGEVGKDNGINIGLKTYPNPATEAVKIDFSLEKALENAEISILNLSGQKVNTLYSGKLLKGQHNFEWQLDTSQGNKVATGVYLLKISSGNLNKSSVLIVK